MAEEKIRELCANSDEKTLVIILEDGLKMSEVVEIPFGDNFSARLSFRNYLSREHINDYSFEGKSTPVLQENGNLGFKYSLIVRRKQ